VTVPVGDDGTGSADGSSSAGESSSAGRSDLARTGTVVGLLVGLAGALTLTGAGAMALRHRVGRR
jgi:hypothetical protein